MLRSWVIGPVMTGGSLRCWSGGAATRWGAGLGAVARARMRWARFRRDYRVAGAGRAWGPVSGAPPAVSASSAVGLAGRAIWIGWAGRNKTARRAPAAATPAATRQLMV